MTTHNDYCIILAGGGGKRLWPCSRRQMPKQFLDFMGTGRTLLQQTYDRYVHFLPKENIYISTFKDYVGLVREQLPDLPEENILAEPVQLSTAPAVTWASYHISMKNPEANIVVTPADQHIVNEAKFAEQIRSGLDFVKKHQVFLAMGVKPTVPNTAYGYIQMGPDSKEHHLFRVKSFSEKPAPEYARMFMESGEFLWNTGIFLWHAPTMLEMLEKLTPIVSEHISKTGSNLSPDEEPELVKRFYPSNMHISIDLVILEKCSNVYIQQCDFGWADIGCWPELHEVMPKDADGNTILNNTKIMLSDCRDNVICLPKGMGAVLRGLEGYVIAQEGNMLVVCPNNDPALVRRLGNEAQMKLGDEFI